MDAIGSFVAGAVGIAIAVGWIAAIFVVAGVLVFRHRRRAMERGTYPVRLLPWFLGGTPEMDVQPPRESHRIKRRRRVVKI